MKMTMALKDPLAINDHVEEMAGVARLVADCGQNFEAVHFGPVLPERDCFANAFFTAVNDAPDEYIYVEGFALHPSAGTDPLPHAWVIDHDGVVLDPTWPWNDLPGRPGHQGNASYRGIPIRKNWLMRTVHSQRRFGVLHLLVGADLSEVTWQASFA